VQITKAGVIEDLIHGDIPASLNSANPPRAVLMAQAVDRRLMGSDLILKHCVRAVS
jgi:hypothetical protein